MKFSHFYKAIKIDDLSVTPKYLQLANSIISAIEHEFLKKDDLLPSITHL
jgi:DNA-binding transcriptional regulator YhcF (GntR family)